MAEYKVNLEVFAGPLDLLLYLVRKEEVDIYDIPIARITEQYLHYLDMLKSLDIDLAGDFLVMAATLMHIKSAMLLPQAEGDQLQAEDLADPRGELIRQLLEYKRFKDAANLLSSVVGQHSLRHSRPANALEPLKTGEKNEIDIDQVSIWDLLAAFDSILKATGAGTAFTDIRDDTPIDLYQIEILHRLQTEGPMTFHRIFESATNKLVMIGLFLALLELVREKLVWVEQGQALGELYLRALTEEPAQQAVQQAIRAAADDEQNLQPEYGHKKSEIPIEIRSTAQTSKDKVPDISQTQPTASIADADNKNKTCSLQNEDVHPRPDTYGEPRSQKMD